jgi:hypothetical protein
MAEEQPHIFPEEYIHPTYGVHNPPRYSPCAHHDCLYPRRPWEPSDPMYPIYWSAKWTMYIVFNNYDKYPPPYDGCPPKALEEGKDYTVSYGETYYDSTWRGPNGEEGAMMEFYKKVSLPIFPTENQYTSAFISLGDKAYYLTFDDKPKDIDLPPICLMSPVNHPPRRDFIKHLPYSAGDSARLGGRVQGYSLWASMEEGKPPIQTGAYPDRTGEGILFGYAFKSYVEPDAHDKTAPAYRHPHSFYFSGFPVPPVNAPIVSQNYTEFSMKKPDPAKTWDLVAKHADGKPIPPRYLFDGFGRKKRSGKSANLMAENSNVPTWTGKRK